MSEPRGEISYTARELLERIEKKVDVIDEKLDEKADRERVHALANAMMAIEGRLQASANALEGRLTLLEAQALKREGPLVEELRQYEREVDRLGNLMTRLENGVGSRIQKAIEENNRSSREAADRAFTRREKVFGLSLAMIAALGTLISTLVLLDQLGARPGA